MGRSAFAAGSLLLLSAALALLTSGASAQDADKIDFCNVNMTETCGPLADRKCPDVFSGHPDNLDTCCRPNSQGCFTACCASTNSRPPAVVLGLVACGVAGALFLLYLCRLCMSQRTTQHARAQFEEEEWYGPDGNSIGMHPNAVQRAALPAVDEPPAYYGDLKPPDYNSVPSSPRGSDAGGTMSPLPTGTPPAVQPTATASEREHDEAMAFPPPYEDGALAAEAVAPGDQTPVQRLHVADDYNA